MKQQLIELIDEDSEDNKVFDGVLRLPSNVPPSDIVFREEKEEKEEREETANFHDKAVAMYEKYIGDNAPFLINVSHRMKTKIKSKLFQFEADGKKLEDIALLHIFDSTQREIWLMMNGSFRRFQKTVAYSALNKQLLSSQMRKPSTSGLSTHSITGSIKKGIKNINININYNSTANLFQSKKVKPPKSASV